MQYAGVSLSYVATHQHEHLYTSCRHLSCSLGVTHRRSRRYDNTTVCVFQAELTASDAFTQHTRAYGHCSEYFGPRNWSVCPSDTRVLCDETKKHTAEILIPNERVINLVFWYQKMLVGDVTFHLKFALKVTPPRFEKLRLDQYLLITSQL